jgi:hypothetical protein
MAGASLAASDACANFHINNVVNNSSEPVNVASTAEPGKTIGSGSLGWNFHPLTISGPSLGVINIKDGPQCPGASWAAEIKHGNQKWGFAYEGNGVINLTINADSSVTIGGSGTPGGNGRVVPGGCGPIVYSQQGPKLVTPGAANWRGGPYGLTGAPRCRLTATQLSLAPGTAYGYTRATTRPGRRKPG